MTSRRRFVAGFAALVALTGTLVFGGAIVANADAVINFGGATPAQDSTSIWTPTAYVLEGTTTNTLYTDTIDVVDYSSGSPDPVCTGIDPSSGTWSCPTTLDAGFKDIRVFQATNSDTRTFSLNPPAPTIDQPNGFVVPYGVPFTFSGTNSWTGGNVSVTVFERAITCADPDVSDGTWSCEVGLDDDPVAGTFTLRVYHQAQGSSSAVTEISFTVAEALQITSPAQGGEVEWSADGITVSGTSPSSSGPIDVYLDGEFLMCTAPAAVNWTCDTPVIDLGAHFLTAQQEGLDDSQVNFSVILPTPDVDQTGYSYSPGTEFAVFSGDTSTYTGAEVWVGLEVSDSSTIYCSDVSGADGWSCQIPIDTLGSDTYNVFVYQESGLDTSYSLTLQLEVGAPATPPMSCTFTPAGFAVSSPYTVGGGLYPISPYSGGGSSHGGGGFELEEQGACNGDPGYQDPSVTVWESGPPVASGNCGAGDCNASGLAPGIYDLYYTLSDGDESSYGQGFSYEPFDYLFRIPETPTPTETIGTTNSVLLRGTGTAGDEIRVVRSSGTTLCTTSVTGAGTWACQFPKSSATSARALAIDPQSGGISAYSESRNIPIFIAPIAPPVAVEPPAVVEEPVTLVNWFLEFGGDLMDLKPGDTFTLSVSGMPVGTEIEIWMYSTPKLLGTATGTGLPMDLELTVPEDIESGPHEIRMIGVTPLGTQYFFTSDAVVIGGTAPAEPNKDEGVLDDKGTAGTADRTDPATPSALSDGLAPLSAIVANPATIAIAGGLALALLFLVALPTELLNSSLSSNTSRLGRAYGAVDGAMTKAQDWLVKVTRSRAIAAGILVVVVAIIYGFVDPGFGFDIVSLRLVLSLAIAFFLLSFVASWISGMIIRRAWGAMGVVAMQPSIILFAIVGVIVARVLDFSPGFLVGIAIGLELLQASKTVTAKAVFVQLGVVTGLALAAWVVYSFFTPGDDFVGMLVEDTLVATTAEGLTGALIAVFPLKFLDGRELWEVSKRLWVAAFLLVSTAFALLVLPTAIAGTDVADYGTWLLVFAVFGLGSLVVWLIFVRADARAAKAESEKVDA